MSSEWENFSKDDRRVKLQEIPQSNLIWRAPWMKNVACLMGYGKKPWVPLMGVTEYVSYAPTRGEQIRFGSVFIKKSNQTEFKKKKKTETGSNQPVSVRFS